MENINKFFFSWILIILFILFGFFLIKNNLLGHPMSKWTSDVQVDEVQYVKIAGKIIKIDLALTPEAQARGLSGRNELKNDTGMLFVFERADKYSFWMRDMNFPIDIIWLAPSESGDWKDLHVVYIKKNALPESYPKTFTPDREALYVLEIISHFSEKNNLKVGDQVEFLSF